MSVPTNVSSGDYTRPLQDGGWNVTHPFAKVGDPDTFIAKRTMIVLYSSFQRPKMMASMTFPRETGGLGYLVDIEGPEYTNGGLCSYVEVWASLPKPRIEYGPVVGEFFYLISGELNAETGERGQPSLVQNTERVQGTILYQYSLNKPLPTLRKLLYVQQSGTIYRLFGDPVPSLSQPIAGTSFSSKATTGGWNRTPGTPFGSQPQTVPMVLTENAVSEIWMGKIYVRESRLAEERQFIAL